MSEKTEFQKIVDQLRQDLKILTVTMIGNLRDIVPPWRYVVSDKTKNWIFDVFLDKLYEVNYKIVQTFEEFGLKNVELPLEPIEGCAKEIATGSLEYNDVKIKRLVGALDTYCLDVDKALNSVRKFMYSTKWSKMKKIETPKYAEPIEKQTKTHDFFICHASEDKEPFVRGLAEKLRKTGYKIWYDEFSLRLGDSLRKMIDYGLASSKYGIVVLSKSFFEKKWPQDELDGLVVKEKLGIKVVLPVWHGVTKEDVENFSPTLAGRLAVSTNTGLDNVVKEVLKVIENS